MTRLEKAIHNNVLWYEVICQAHGIPRDFRPGLWLTYHEMPLFYSNALIFSDALEPAEVEKHLQTLITLKFPFAIKDSLARLELSSFGFQLLFEASWIWRTPTPRLKNNVDGILWTTVQSAGELENWEMTWSDEPTNQGTQTRIFLPSLLDDEGVRFIAAYRGNEILAGAIANLTDGVVGVSNVFAPNDGL